QVRKSYLYRMATGFHQVGLNSAWAIRKHDATAFMMIGPAAVNLALAIELYLKAIHSLSASRPPNTHELWRLFKTLPQLTMLSLGQKYKDILPTKVDQLKAIHMTLKQGGEQHKAKPIPSSTTVKELLTAHNHSFMNWRYLHEFSSKGYDYHFDFHAIDVFGEILNSHIAQLLKLRPPHFSMTNVQTGKAV
ncbi:hypothetical protein J7E24_10480, partial [Hymenobacter sp. ISL-91]|uniref:hypothetical protein n=1 Tax=Hymenobacter sp. ISL-91 TaxID=2819151 RepID=UPI001BED0C10